MERFFAPSWHHRHCCFIATMQWYLLFSNKDCLGYRSSKEWLLKTFTSFTFTISKFCDGYTRVIPSMIFKIDAYNMERKQCILVKNYNVRVLENMKPTKQPKYILLYFYFHPYSPISLFMLGCQSRLFRFFMLTFFRLPFFETTNNN